MRRAFALGAAFAIAFGLAGAAASTSGDVWKNLRRPLHIPAIAAGAECPVSPPAADVDFASYGLGQGFGPGPAYPIFGKAASIAFDYPPPRESISYGSKWSGQKVLWFLLPGRGDRVLIRGRQLDGPYRARFGLGAPVPAEELKLVGSGDHPATTRLRTGGCYGYQIDGSDYSHVVVFKANLRCLAAPVEDGRVYAGPFAGQVSRNYVVDARFRLHDLRAGPGLTNKMGWFLPRKRATEAPWLSVKGVRLAPPGRVFTDRLAEIFGAGFPDDQHVYASNLKPPTEGCWRLTFKARRLTGSLVVLVRNG